MQSPNQVENKHVTELSCVTPGNVPVKVQPGSQDEDEKQAQYYQFMDSTTKSETEFQQVQARSATRADCNQLQEVDGCGQDLQ
mmetsp:Transcript_2376/g.6187  ORF Transcript_2376/g.6187 Transcript_2376/m.6187 type:complete len:83 (-) Transcript_2376:156-404(-)